MFSNLLSKDFLLTNVMNFEFLNSYKIYKVFLKVTPKPFFFNFYRKLKDVYLSFFQFVSAVISSKNVRIFFDNWFSFLVIRKCRLSVTFFRNATCCTHERICKSEEKKKLSWTLNKDFDINL